MKLTGAEIVVRALEAEGIRHTFGIPGTHNIELYQALLDSEVTPVLVTDEQSAGFMADGYWRASGRMACVNLVPGAGLTHALSGIGEAFLDGVPMLVLGCGIRRESGRAFQLHDVDQLAIAAPLTKARFRPEHGSELYRTIREACAIARGGTPGPVMVEVSVDHYLTRHDVSLDWQPGPAAAPSPSAADITRAGELLSAPGARPLLYLGLGAREAQPELIALAERLGAPVCTTISGKGVFPESHPLFRWNGLGAMAPPFVREATERCTVTLAIGCRFSEVGTGSWSFTPPGQLIHVDINPDVLNRNFPAALSIVSDAKVFIAKLLGELAGKTAGRQDGEAFRRELATSPGVSVTDRVNPGLLLRAIQRAFGLNTIYTADSGNGTFLAMEILRLDRPGQFLAPVDYSCMGYAVPAAIGAGISRPDAPVVALAGDGAFLMTGLELLTAAHLDVPVAVFVLRDRTLAQIAQFQDAAFARRSASELPDFHVGSIAEAVGMAWLPLDRDDEIERVVGEARATIQSGRPVLIDVAIDYSEKSWFTRGVVKTTLLRMPWPERIRFVARALAGRLRR